MLRIDQKPCYTIRTLNSVDEPDVVSERAWLLIVDTVEFGWKRLFGAGRLPHLFITVVGAPILGPPGPAQPGEPEQPFTYHHDAMPSDQEGGLACCAVGMHMIVIASGEKLMSHDDGFPGIPLAEWVRALALSVLTTLLVYKQEVHGDRRWMRGELVPSDPALDGEAEQDAEALLEELLRTKGRYRGSN